MSENRKLAGTWPDEQSEGEGEDCDEGVFRN